MTKLGTHELFTFAAARSWRRSDVARLRSLKRVCMIFVFCVATALLSPASTTFTSLVSFDVTDGGYPLEISLVQGFDGNLYGTASVGGANGGGVIFKITPEGTLTTVYNFCSQTGCADGDFPYAGLVQATNGDLYGTTYQGGHGYGTIFRISSAGALTTLHSFDVTDGANPDGSLVQATNGDFYGVTVKGGANNEGTIFKITPEGTLTTLYQFCSKTDCADGEQPTAGLVQGIDGNFYGTTVQGGNLTCDSPYDFGCGTMFSITPGGELTTLYTFCSLSNCADGENPNGLVQAANGSLYGTTFEGGASGSGTVFKVNAADKLTTLYNFCSQTECADGKFPVAGMVQATDGNFYGTTSSGGTGDDGTVFEITAEGKLTTLHRFDGTDGSNVYAVLLQATNGTFYGTTFTGGTDDYGTVFSLSVGLGPFVKTLPAAGRVGAEVEILGTDLTGAASVTFSSTPAQFTVHSPSLILAHVPSGATTGTIEVTLPGQTLSSNAPFHVLP
jgi:uncharacterized repeat protein (TIGR03803 family)